MSLPDPTPPRKPRRLGLFAPFGLLLIAVAGWTAFWIAGRAQLERRLDAAVADLGRAGWQVGWSGREIGGYPFRIDLTLTDARLREPSGWGLEVPVLEAEGYAYAPGHWMFAAPQGLTFVRPDAGPVRVTGKVLRASLSRLDQRPPSLDLQGRDLAFQPAPGAQPFALTAAELIELHLRAGPDDQGGVFAQLTGGRATPAGLFGRIAGDKPVSLTWNSTLSKMSAFGGSDWAAAVRRWSDAGGAMTVRDARFAAGDALLQTEAGTLGAGRDGRLRGVLPVSLRQAPRMLGAMAETGMTPAAAAAAASAVANARRDGDAARATLNFEAGRTTLGPVALGPAPKVYTPH